MQLYNLVLIKSPVIFLSVWVGVWCFDAVLLCVSHAGTLTGLFYQIQHSEDELVRERCIRFVHAKLRSLGSQIFTPEVEALILAEAKKVLQVIHKK